MEYEIITEVFNPCGGDRPMSTSFEETTIDDPESYVRSLHPAEASLELSKREENGSLVIEINIKGNITRFTFTEV